MDIGEYFNHDFVKLESQEALPPTGQIILIVLYTATAILSFVGNSLVLIVLYFGSKLRVVNTQPPQLVLPGNLVAVGKMAKLSTKATTSVVHCSQTVSFNQRQVRHCNFQNYLMNLALSDLAMSLFSIPFTYSDFMLGRWIFPAVLCRLAPTINVLAITVSVYTMILISLDRSVFCCCEKKNTKNLLNILFA